MGRYFGTDGFRGEANVNLTADHAYKVGRFLGWYYGELKIDIRIATRSNRYRQGYPSFQLYV